jgi:transcriptional regulator with XRE-family HTH domain
MWSHAEVLRTKRARQRNLLCEQLKAARQKARLTQVQVAKLLGRHQTFMTRVESGKHPVTFLEVEQLAEIYGESLQSFATLDAIVRKDPRLQVTASLLDTPYFQTRKKSRPRR